MGGCVVSVMSTVNSVQQVPHPLMQQTHMTPIQTVEVDRPDYVPKPHQSRIRRSVSVKDLTQKEQYDRFYRSVRGGVTGMLKATVQRHRGARAMAYRPWDHIEKTEIEEDGKKKPWELIHLKETQYITFDEMWERITAFGHGLAKLGLQPGSFIGIYEETRWEWLVSLYGAWSQGLTGVTVYSNLGEDALRYAIKESDLPAMVLNGKSVKGLIQSCKAAGVRVPKLIYLDTLPADLDTEGAEVIPWGQVVESGRGMPEPDLNADPDELALVMYTSGTTGNPKGVMITHGNVSASVLNIRHRVEQVMQPDRNETYICVLPLAHILEFAAEQVAILRGGCLCFSHPRTLTDLSTRPRGDFMEYKPTFLIGVPRLYDTIKKGVYAKLPPEGSLKRRVFERAYEERRLAMLRGFDTPYWNHIAFQPIRNLLGGRLRLIVSGGAPLSSPTHEFLAVVVGCAVCQGYGLTETCAILTMQRYELSPESIGCLMPGIDLMLRDVEDWKHTNNPPQGEICVRGPAVTKGYYKQPDKTTEAYETDGWFHTGDIGQVQPDGSLRIIGRTKALAKNIFGEYVAMEALEAMYVQNDLVTPNGVCVLVNPTKAYIAAIVLTDEKKAMKFAGENKIEGTWPDILQKPEFHQKAAVSLAETAKKAGKKPFETVKYVRVVNDEWTPQNGILTAAMKAKRSAIDKRYADTIAELFAE